MNECLENVIRIFDFLPNLVVAIFNSLNDYESMKKL